MRNPAESQDEYEDEDEDGRIWPKVKLTPYDRRRLELSELQAKSDAIFAKGELDERDHQKLAELAPVLAKAKARFKREIERAQDDVYRKCRSIDEWRADAGRKEYNSKRRKVRYFANADLSEMTPEEKAQYKRDQKSDANFLARLRKKKMSEAAITALYMSRLEDRKRKREAERAAKFEEIEIDAELSENPTYGIF